MHVDLEKILIHANDRLAAFDSGAERQQHVDAFRRFLKIETERLRIRHQFGLGGGEITSGRSYLVDLVVCRACRLVADGLGPPDSELANCAVIALGGYGRRELAPGSDVDVLFLRAGKGSALIKQFVEQVLYLLWDMGLTVGHSFRSIRQSVTMAREDLHCRNSMSEARLVTGNASLFRRFVREMEETVYKDRRANEAFLDAMYLERDARYAKFGRTVCLQEPNVKESAGGLRDLHTVIWVAYARHGCKTLDDLRAADHVSGAEYASARRAYDFISRVRNEAHFSTGRKTDLLTLDTQPAIASGLNFEARRGLQASELFMREYYVRASELHHFCQSFLTRAFSSRAQTRRFRLRAERLTTGLEVKKGKLYLTRKSGPSSEPAGASFEVKAGRLHLREESGDFGVNPMRLLEVFSALQQSGARLSDQLKLAVRSGLTLVDRRFRGMPESGDLFAELLRRPGRVAGPLRAMHETGFLGRFLPEFGRITFLVQHDRYHRYTIDEHTLKAIETLDSLEGTRESELHRFRKVLQEIKDPAALYLGLLFHDIGKGHGGGHVQRGVRIAEQACARLGLESGVTQDVVFLVRNHLLMSHISQRRDLTEETLIEEFTATAGTIDRLNMLLLLTYADTSGVGPGVWNDWKGALLWELYSRARARMANNRVTVGRTRAASRKDRATRRLQHEFPASEVERHLAMLPERYIRANGPDDIARHFRLIRRMADGPLAVEWTADGRRNYAELTVCARDSAGLFSRLAGTLTVHGINILSADLYTREDGIVIDTLKVAQIGGDHPVRPERLTRVEHSLREAIEGRADVDAAVAVWRGKSGKPPKRYGKQPPVRPAVRFDADASATSSIIEIRAEDHPGLAHTIASTLAGLGINIILAKIATEKSHALDVFYVTDSDGRKLSHPEMLNVERALIRALGGDAERQMKEAV